MAEARTAKKARQLLEDFKNEIKQILRQLS